MLLEPTEGGAAVYSYDFGTATGTYSTASGSSTSFLPAAPSGSDYVRIGTGGGSIALVNPGNATLGSGSELLLTAPTNSSVNKFAISDYASATALAQLSFGALFEGTSGAIQMVTGNGTTFADGNQFSSAQTFVNLQFTLGPSGINTYNYSGGVYGGLTTSAIVTGSALQLDLFQNNGTTAATYSFNNFNYTVAANRYDLFLGGVLIGNDLGTVDLADGTAIDSFMFYGTNSVGNVGKVSLDNFTYATTVPAALTEVGSIFDVNGATAGSGVTNNGVYTFSGGYFSASTDGTTATGLFTPGATPVFSAGTDAAGLSYTVNLSAATSFSGLTVEEGNVRITGDGTGPIDITLTNATVSVASGASVNLAESLVGSVGLSKVGGGTATLSAANSFTGNITATGGTLSISTDGNLGATTNDLVLDGGTLASTATFSLSAGRDLTGTGTLAITPSTTLTVQGTTDAGLTLSNTGGLTLAGASNTLSSLTYSAGATVSVTGGTLSLTGNVTATSLSGTAVLSGPVSLSGTNATEHTFSTVGHLTLSGNLSGAGTLVKTGSRSLTLTGSNNSGFSGFIRHGAVGVSGGTIFANNSNALGTNQYQANGGTLNVASFTTFANAISIGANTTIPATFAGNVIQFTGAANLAGGATAHGIQVSGSALMFSGVFGPTPDFTTSTLTITGGGQFVLGGTAPNTFTEAVTASGAQIALAKQGALGANTALTLNNGGSLIFDTGLATNDHINNAAAVNLNGGSILMNYHSEGSAGVNGVGTLTLSANSTIDFTFGADAFSTIQFGGIAQTVNGTILSITGHTFGGDHLYFAGNANSFINLFTQSEVRFDGMLGYNAIQFDGYYEIYAIPEPATIGGVVGLVGLIGYRERKRLAGMLGRTC